MKKRVAVLGAVVVSTAAIGEEKIYRWTGPDGTVHYSNEPQRVPQAPDAQTTEGEEIGVVPAAAKQPEAKPTKEQLEERKLHAEIRRAEAEATRAESEILAAQQRTWEQWRTAFRDARAKIARLQAELDEERALLEVNGLPVIGRTVTVVRPITPAGVIVVDRYERALVRVPQLEKALAEARDELDELDRQASFAGVPRNMRQ